MVDGLVFFASTDWCLANQTLLLRADKIAMLITALQNGTIIQAPPGDSTIHMSERRKVSTCADRH